MSDKNNHPTNNAPFVQFNSRSTSSVSADSTRARNGHSGNFGAKGPADSSGQKKSPEQKNASNGPGKRSVLIVLGIVVVAIAIWVLVWLFACGGSGMFDANARDGQAPYKTEEEIQAELNRQVDEGMFNISIASAISFEDGQSEGTAYIENVPGNRYNMKVSITDDDTGEVLYESGVLKPNQFIEKIALTKDLDQGVYAATATFTALDQTTFEEVGQAGAKVAINVLN